MSDVVARRLNVVYLISIIYREYIPSLTWAAQMSRDIVADEALLCDKAVILSSTVRNVLCKFAAVVGNQIRFSLITLWHHRDSWAIVMSQTLGSRIWTEWQEHFVMWALNRVYNFIKHVQYRVIPHRISETSWRYFITHQEKLRKRNVL